MDNCRIIIIQRTVAAADVAADDTLIGHSTLFGADIAIDLIIIVQNAIFNRSIGNSTFIFDCTGIDNDGVFNFSCRTDVDVHIHSINSIRIRAFDGSVDV